MLIGIEIGKVYKMKIAVAGTGYVGLALSTLLSQKYEVVAYDIVPEKVKKINERIPHLKDEDIETFFKEKQLNLRATLDYKDAFNGAEFIIVSTPTNYDVVKNHFDTSNVEDIIVKVKEMGIDTTIIIKSTVPVGFTKRIKEKYNMNNIIFSPEFCREGKALYDSLYPSRIIMGEKSERAEKFGNILRECSMKKDAIIKYMDSTEAEAVKLFANTYLALRVAFFNELDTYSEINNLNTKDIIDGICTDARIGNQYNNPSFGYGGYCLPKDTKQLLANYDGVPQEIIEAIVTSNVTRKKYIADRILSKNPNVVGIYRLIMKSNSDNFRSSAICDVINYIKEAGKKIVIYEPSLSDDTFEGIEVIHDLDKFKEMSDVIVVNRIDKDLNNVKKKVYTRDIFSRD